LGNDLSVTTTRAPVSRRIADICSGSSSGLTGLTIPTIAPPAMATAVSMQLGSTSATTSSSPIFRLRNRLAA
jgi:hypothetical protein